MDQQSLATTDYLGAFQYQDGALDFVAHSEGYVKALNAGEATEYHYVYNYTDHLGNVRLRYGIDPETEEVAILHESHYYPFGLSHNGYVSTHKTLGFGMESDKISLVPVRNYLDDTYRYDFNAKEHQPELGLNWHDYHARNYDAALGRWMNVDPMGEQAPGWTPYRYGFNNPIRYTDPTGLFEDDYGLDNNGKITFLRDTDDSTDRLIVMDNDGNETDKSIEIEKGILNKIENTTVKDSDDVIRDVQIIEVTNSENAICLFEFIADNSNNEFSYSSWFSNRQFISTSFQATAENSINVLYPRFRYLLHHIHSHLDPYLAPSPGDIGTAGIFRKRLGYKPRFEIYSPFLKQYKDYDENSVSFELEEVRLNSKKN